MPRKTIDEFKKFIARGNVIDLAVGIVIGAAFTAIVQSLVKDVVNPLLGVVTGNLDFSNYFLALNGQVYETLAQAREAGAPVPRPLMSASIVSCSKIAIMARMPAHLCKT